MRQGGRRPCLAVPAGEDTRAPGSGHKVEERGPEAVPGRSRAGRLKSAAPVGAASPAAPAPALAGPVGRRTADRGVPALCFGGRRQFQAQFHPKETGYSGDDARMTSEYRGTLGKRPGAWSPQGDRLLFTSTHREEGFGLPGRPGLWTLPPGLRREWGPRTRRRDCLTGACFAPAPVPA